MRSGSLWFWVNTYGSGSEQVDPVLSTPSGPQALLQEGDLFLNSSSSIALGLFVLPTPVPVASLLLTGLLPISTECHAGFEADHQEFGLSDTRTRCHWWLLIPLEPPAGQRAACQSSVSPFS